MKMCKGIQINKRNQMMKNHKTQFALIYFFLIGFCGTGFCGKIIYPWNAATAIVKAGENVTVWFNADEGQTVTSAKLCSPCSTVSIPLVARQTVGSPRWPVSPVLVVGQRSRMGSAATGWQPRIRCPVCAPVGSRPPPWPVAIQCHHRHSGVQGFQH